MVKKTSTEQTSIVSDEVKKLKNLKKLSVLFLYTNIDKVKMFHVLQNKVAPLTRRCSELGNKKSSSPKIFRKVDHNISVYNRKC